MVRSPRFSNLVPLLFGIALTIGALALTYQTYHPLPPGSGHVDGRGLFAPLVIVPMATFGGVLIGDTVLKNVWTSVPLVVRLGLYPVFATIVTSGPVMYMVFGTGPDIEGNLTAYVNWYSLAIGIGVLSALVSLGVYFARRTIGRTIRPNHP